MRAFNSHENFSRSEDALPEKMFHPLKGGASDGVALDRSQIEEAKDAYYRMADGDKKAG